MSPACLPLMALTVAFQSGAGVLVADIACPVLGLTLLCAMTFAAGWGAGCQEGAEEEALFGCPLPLPMHGACWDMRKEAVGSGQGGVGQGLVIATGHWPGQHVPAFRAGHWMWVGNVGKGCGKPGLGLSSRILRAIPLVVVWEIG